MYKYLTALVLSVLSFYTIKTFLSSRKIEPDSLIVEIDTTVLENDIFYVYYSTKEQKHWSDEFSEYNRVMGNKKEQELTFVLPLNKVIQRIRIDIGANKLQQPIEIKSLTLKSKVGQETFSNDLTELFKLNTYATYQNELFVPKIISGRYDPFMVSNDEINALLRRLQETTPMFSANMVNILALIFSLALFTYSIATPIKLSADYFAIAFILIITAPLLTSILEIEPSGINLEKRELAKMPKISFTEEFPKDFETYYDDNFGLRSTIIQLSSKIKINVFRSSPKPELVQFGKDGFLFYNSLNDDIFNSYTNQNLLLNSDLEDYYKTFSERKEELKEKGIVYVVGFWPNKHSIYSEKMPNSMKSQVKRDHSLADQIIQYFSEKEMHFFDVRKNLINAKQNNLLYRKFDTHWNSDGAFLGYRAFCEQTFDFLGLVPFKKSDFEIIYKRGFSGDLTEQIGVESIVGLFEEVPTYMLKDKHKDFKQVSSSGYPKGSIVTKNSNAAQQKRLLVFRDSFTSQLIQFLSLHYTEVIYLKEKYNKQLIEKLNPEVVLSCRVERYMLSM